MSGSMNAGLVRVQPQIFSAQAARFSMMIGQDTSVSSSGSSSRISFQQVFLNLTPASFRYAASSLSAVSSTQKLVCSSKRALFKLMDSHNGEAGSVLVLRIWAFWGDILHSESFRILG